MNSTKRIGHAPLFDPEEGTPVIEPLGLDKRWWAGASSSVLPGIEQLLPLLPVTALKRA